MISHYVLSLFEPKIRYLCQHLAFVRNTFIHYYIKRGNAICCNNKQGIAKIVDISNFSASFQFQIWKICLCDDRFHKIIFHKSSSVNEQAILSADSSRFKYSSREISRAPNFFKCGVIYCVSNKV